MLEVLVERRPDLFQWANLDDVAGLEAELLAVDAVGACAVRLVRIAPETMCYPPDVHPHERAEEPHDADVAVSDLGDVLPPLARMEGRGRAERLGDLAAVDLFRAVVERLRRPCPVAHEGTEPLERRLVAAPLRCVRLDSLDPGLLPVDPAFRLAAAVGRAVAAEVLEEERPGKPPRRALGGEPADLLDTLRDAIVPIDVGDHLRHERDAFDGSLLVERREDLVRGPHADGVARSQFLCAHIHSPFASVSPRN